MGLADGPTQAVRGPGHGDQVDVIGHEAVRPDFNLLGKAELGHQLQVAEVILVAEKRLLPAVSPLGDVVRQTRDDDTCQSGHEGRLSYLRRLGLVLRGIGQNWLEPGNRLVTQFYCTLGGP